MIPLVRLKSAEAPISVSLTKYLKALLKSFYYQYAINPDNLYI